MKPHSLRRGLWLLNVVLAAGVAGLGAWLVLKVRPAVARVVEERGARAGAPYQAVHDDYEAQRASGLQWRPQAPVSLEEIGKVVLRDDYKRKRPTHWIFSGPLPPPDSVEDPGAATGPPPPKGLEALGKVPMVIFDEDDGSTILFNFGGERSLAFRVGDFVKQKADDPDRFLIKEVVALAGGGYEIRYEIRDPRTGKPEGEATLQVPGRAAAQAPFLHPVGATPAPAAGPDGTGAAPGAATSGTGTSAPGGPAVETAGASDGEQAGPGTPAVIESASKPADDLTLEDLRPVVEWDTRDPRRSRLAVKFDDNTYRYFRERDPESLAKTVRTAVKKDATGRILGLEIRGFTDKAPAQVLRVQPGDILVSINGRRVESEADVISIAKGVSEDSLVTVVIDRHGKIFTYIVDPRDPHTRRAVRYFDEFRDR